MQQSTQEGKRTVDIGVFLFGNQLNYIFCVEAKFLPHSPFDYVTGEYEDGGKIFRKQKRSFLGSWSTEKGSWSSMD